MERNFKEDQTNEVEALDSIYCGEMEILESEPFHRFKIPIATEEYSPDDESSGLACHLVFTYTARYPDEAPLVEIEDDINFNDNCQEELLQHVDETIKENIGIEMIFSLVSSAQEFLNVQWDNFKKMEENRQQLKLEEFEEAERKRFEGTRVTVETFLSWRKQFEDETGITAKKEKILAEFSKKLTGKELFLTDITLNESDLKFLLEAGDTIESVKIDESLFQNLDDLELDSDAEDEDYVPGKEIY